MTNPENREQTQEEKRQIALTNLKDKAINSLAIAYLVENVDGEGENNKSAIHNFKYLPAFDSKTGQKLIKDEIIESRQDEKRYTGTFTEYNLIKRAAAIRDQSLGNVTVNDILELTGSDAEVDAQYKDKYVKDLITNEATKKVAQKIIGIYNTYFVDKQVSEARNESAKHSKHALENLVKPAA